ncbi:sel1 repeat family protein [Candidatus Obscuribacterales bacterium]|nr:sel1 repeat family protein [Candidatus Obscuribacterales bacterium]
MTGSLDSRLTNLEKFALNKFGLIGQIHSQADFLNFEDCVTGHSEVPFWKAQYIAEHRQTCEEIRELWRSRDNKKLMKLGVDLEHGKIGSSKDRILPVVCYFLAAKLGDPKASSYLGDMMTWGSGTKKDYELARHLYLRSIDNGYTEAIPSLVALYPELKFPSAPIIESLKILVEKGDLNAQIGLATLYWHLSRESDLDPKNSTLLIEARKLAASAANSGSVKAQNLCGFLCAQSSKDCPAELDTAKSWYEKASAQGDEHARESLKKLLAVQEKEKSGAAPTVVNQVNKPEKDSAPQEDIAGAASADDQKSAMIKKINEKPNIADVDVYLKSFPNDPDGYFARSVLEKNDSTSRNYYRKFQELRQRAEASTSYSGRKFWFDAEQGGRFEQFERMHDYENALSEAIALTAPFLELLDSEDEMIYKPSDETFMSTADIGALMLMKKAKLEFKLHRFSESIETLGKIMVYYKRSVRSEVESASVDSTVDQEKETLVAQSGLITLYACRAKCYRALKNEDAAKIDEKQVEQIKKAITHSEEYDASELKEQFRLLREELKEWTPGQSDRTTPKEQ